MTVADVSSSIQVIEQRIASISPTAAQVFGTPATTGASTPASFASQLQTAGVDQTGTGATTLPDLVPSTTATTTPIVPAGTTPLTSTTDTQYDSLIQQAARDQGVDPALLKGLVQAESGFNPTSVSSVGAQGLTQLMPDTAKGLGVSNAFDPLQNLEGGARFLAGALKRFGGNEQLALAAYNAGPGAVERYGGIPPYAETQAYVPRVLDYANQYRAAGFGQTPAVAATTTPGLAAPVAAPSGNALSTAVATAPSETAQHAIAVASQFIGTPYHFGGASPATGFDCSGLAQYAYGQSGVTLPRVAADQFKVGQPVDRASLQPGDIVFFHDSTGYIHHEGIYLGNDQFLQAPHTGDVVKISSLDEPYYAGQFAGGRRMA